MATRVPPETLYQTYLPLVLFNESVGEIVLVENLAFRPFGVGIGQRSNGVVEVAGRRPVPSVTYSPPHYRENDILLTPLRLWFVVGALRGARRRPALALAFFVERLHRFKDGVA